MGYALHWSEEQIEQAAEKYGREVSERLRKALENKDRQISGLRNPAQLPTRFHNAFTLGGLKVVEIRFNVHGKEFRAICVVLHDLRVVAFHTVVDKSNQEKRLQRMRRDAAAIETAFRERFHREDP